MNAQKEIQQLLEKLLASGLGGSEIMQKIQNSLGDPRAMEEILETLKEFAGPEQEETLQIEDYYHHGDGSGFALFWPLSPAIPLPMPFEEMDRKTQFFVLFSEWQRRESEGMMELTGGRLDDAQAIFEECYQRAEQIEVYELLARSFEGLMRVAQKRGNRDAELSYSRKAQEARARQGQ